MTRPAGPRLLAISTEIGRGHPSYLDSVLLALSRLEHDPVPSPVSGSCPRPPGTISVTLDQVCNGTCRSAWNLARMLYRAGAHGGLLTGVYNRLRRDTPGQWQLRLLGADLKRYCAGFTGVCLVGHPLVARILAPVCRVAYLHGEIAAPAAGAVPGTWRTFVPLQSTAAGLQASGVEHTALSITGLVVEPALLARAESAFRARRERLAGRAPLCIAFFTSGAYPKPHVRLIVAGTGSCLAAGHRVIVFTGCNPDESGRLRRRLPATTRSLQVITSVDRQQETDRTAELLPQIDLIAAAAHERTNWAAGLGLPLLTLRPDIGPFAPLNRAFAEQNGVSRPLDNDGAETLGSDLTRLRDSGVLTTMADSGHGRFAVDGAARVARHLLDAATR